MNAFSSLSEAALAPALAMPWPWAGIPRQLAALRGHCLVLPVAAGAPSQELRAGQRRQRAGARLLVVLQDRTGGYGHKPAGGTFRVVIEKTFLSVRTVNQSCSAQRGCAVSIRDGFQIKIPYR